MHVTLKGSSPGATTAAILLMTRARQLGLRLMVDVVGDADDITPVPGPAVAYAPVLASCGVGRKGGMGGTIVVSGPPTEPLLVCAEGQGQADWFHVDRGQIGCHPATQAYVRLNQDPRVEAKHLAKEIRRAMLGVGMAPEPAVLDILFGAPLPPLTRLSLALRAGRTISDVRGTAITRFMAGSDPDGDPRHHDFDRATVLDELDGGDYTWMLDRVTTSLRDRLEDWVAMFTTLAHQDGGRDLVLVHALAEIASNLVQLPVQSILPPLDSGMDGVAICISKGLVAHGDGNANFQLGQVFRFLGGQYRTEEPKHSFDVDVHDPPDDTIGRWRWFCKAAIIGRDRADEIWPLIWDAPS
ncbi:MAG: hypothetical protein ACI9MC_003202 [Kiritimatiellia bacterium]|jgi:hypothetical protein